MSNHGEIFEKSLPVLASAKKLRLDGLGEPSLVPDIPEKLEWIKTFNPDIKVHMVTNTTGFLNKKRAKRILSNIDDLHISLNGVKNREKVMIDSSNKLLKKALLNISQIKKELGYPKVTCGFIIMRDIIDDIVPAKRLCKTLGFDGITYKDLWINSPSLNTQSIQHDTDLKSKAIRNLKKAQSIDMHQHTFPQNLLAKEKENKLEKNSNAILNKVKTYYNRIKESKNVPCSAPWDTIKIRYTGEVKLCCFGDTSIGDLRNQSFDDIWNGEEANNYRTGMQSGNYYKDCSRCHVVTDSLEVYEKYKRKEKYKNIAESDISKSDKDPIKV